MTWQCKSNSIQNMKYDPSYALEQEFSTEEILAYQLVCQWCALLSQILPDYNHQFMGVKGDLRKKLIFKHMFKFFRERKDQFKGFQYVIFMRAQLEICAKLISEGKKILVDASLLHGKKADARWCVWKNIIKSKRQNIKASYSFDITNLSYEFQKTKSAIGNILGKDPKFEVFSENASEILKLVVLKKISPIYIFCSKWILKLNDPIKQDILDLSHVSKFNDFNMEEATKMYSNMFSYEINK